MTRLCHLPIKSLRLVQRTLSTGLKAAYWHINRQTNASITQVSSLHFLIHFIYPRLPYRQIMIQDLLNVCGFDGNVNLSDALLSLRVNIGKFTDCIVTDPSATVGDTSFILPNEIQSLRQIPTRFWQLCHKILQFREQRPSNLPVSVKGIHSWNLNSWSPGLPTNVHKTWIVKAMLKQAPVLLQETKWDQANLQYLSHTWPDIKVVATLAKHNPGEQAGVAILFPPGWKVLEERILVQHYAVAARVEYQACTIWLVSIYIPPSSPKAFVSNTLQTIIALTDYPVFVGGDFNRCDQNHFHTWDDFLVQAGLTDVDPALPTYKYQDQESSLDRFLVPSLFLDATQLFACIYGRYSRSIGVALCYMLFHLRRLVTEYGGLRPNIACVRHCSISHHVLDLWQRIYSSLPSTLLNHFRAPPQPSSTACTDSTKIRTQRFPAVVLEAALLPPKGLATTQPFAKGDTIATFAKQDHRLRLLLSQHRKLPFPTATACLVPFLCHCGATHLRLQAMDDLSANTILLLGEPQEWQGLRTNTRKLEEQESAYCM